MPTFIILSSIAADKRHSDLSAKLYSIFILTREQTLNVKLQLRDATFKFSLFTGQTVDNFSFSTVFEIRQVFVLTCIKNCGLFG